MNTRSVVLTAVFLGIIILFSLSIYGGIIEVKNPRNLLGLIGVNNSDDFEFVGSIDLENSSSTQNDGYLSENNKKEISASVKIKKEKEASQVIVKVISGAAYNQKNDITPSSIIASTTALAISLNASSAIAAILPIETSVQILEKIIEKTPEKIPEQIIEQISEEISKQSLEQISTQASEQILEKNIEQNNISAIQENIAGNILISEIMAGIDGGADYEFIELFNPTSNSIDLTGWSIKKKSSTGSESTLVSSSRFEGKIIPSNKYFLLANEVGYNGQVSADVFWPKSYSLAYSNNSVVIYNSNGELVEEISWTEIPKGQSIERESFNNTQFKAQLNPNPRNSQSLF